jgi:hypothetical protein
MALFIGMVVAAVMGGTAGVVVSVTGTPGGVSVGGGVMVAGPGVGGNVWWKKQASAIIMVIRISRKGLSFIRASH